jgi:hypothetical protein
MRLLRFFSPARAFRDLRTFLRERHPHQVLFAALSVAITWFIVVAFYYDSHVEVPYEPKIIYVEQWSANRTEAQILAQQKIDAKKKAKRMAELEARRKERQAEFQRIDNALDAWGL